MCFLFILFLILGPEVSAQSTHTPESEVQQAKIDVSLWGLYKQEQDGREEEPNNGVSLLSAQYLL